MLKKRLLQTTPFFIIYVLATLWIIYELIIERGRTEGWGTLAMYSVLPFIVLLIVTDVALKLLVKKLAWIWAIEAFLSLGLIYYWIVR